MSKSTWALFVLLAVLAVGAIVIATQFRRALVSPLGQRLAGENRLRAVMVGLQAYRNAEGGWPDQLAQPIRRGQLSTAACSGVRYRKPGVDATPDSVVIWRELLLPGVKRGESWSGPEDPAAQDIPAAGLIGTSDGRILRVPPEEFTRRTAAPTP